MIRPTSTVLLLTALFVHGSDAVQGNESSQRTKTAKIDEIVRYYHEKGMLNGVVLVKESGKILYQGAYGIADPQSERSLDLDTAFCLASVSKQFTSMAVMLLAEEGKLDYDDFLTEFLPEFGSFATGVTVHQLLTHSSGIPDYLNELRAHRRGLTNEDVVRILLEHGRLNFPPGARASYSNSGYLLLALIVEKVTGKSFRTFLADRIFEPLGMNRTLVRDVPVSIENRAVGFELAGVVDDYHFYTSGPGGMYSTVGDLSRWDDALYEADLVNPATLQLAFTPNRLANGTATPYGYGWKIDANGPTNSVYHVGGNVGFMTFIHRELKTRNAVIILSNCRRAINSIVAHAIGAVLRGEDPFERGKPGPRLPRVETASYLARLIRTQGIEAAMKEHAEILATKRSEFDLGEEQLNLLGYDHLSAGFPEIALALFKRNVECFPKSSNVYDSLGDALMRMGKLEEARKNYSRSLELDPGNTNAADQLKKIRSMETTPQRESPPPPQDARHTGSPSEDPAEETFVEWVKSTAIPVERWTTNKRLESFLNRVLEGKRIVFIGEPGHFYREKYDVQLLLIRHLVKLGYRHLFLEGLGASMAPPFDHFIKTGEPPKTSETNGDPDPGSRYRQRAFASWVGAKKADFGRRQNAERTRFFDSLLEISRDLAANGTPLRIHPLDIDMIPGGCYAAIDRLLSSHPRTRALDPLRELVTKVEGESVADEITRLEDLREQVKANHHGVLDGLSDEEKRRLLKFVDCLVESIAFLDTARADGRLNRALVRREPAMFRQVQFAMEELAPDAKAILIAHNNHLCKRGDGIPRARKPSVGEMVDRAYPGSVYSIWMLHDHGVVLNPMNEDLIESLPSDPERVESLMSEAGSTYVLPLGTGAEGEQYLSQPRRHSYFTWFETSTLTEQTDAIFFLDEVSPLRE